MSLIGLAAPGLASPICLRSSAGGSKQAQRHGRLGHHAIVDTGGPLNIFQLTLVPRLILASLVIFAALLIYFAAHWLYPGEPTWFSYLWYVWVPPFYDIAFALLVLTPFITATRGRWLRALVLVVITGAVYFASVYVVVNTQGALDAWNDSAYLRFVTMVPTVLGATWILAAATAWLGQLRVSHRYWTYAGIAGLVSGFGFLAANMFQEYTRTYGELSGYVPYWLWPVATCLAIYFGRDRGQTS